MGVLAPVFFTVSPCVVLSLKVASAQDDVVPYKGPNPHLPIGKLDSSAKASYFLVN